MSTVKVLTGVLAGLAAGVVIGILIAPEKGSETRKQMLEKGEGYADDLKSKFEDFVESLNKKYQGIMHKTESLVADSKSIQEAVKGSKA